MPRGFISPCLYLADPSAVKKGVGQNIIVIVEGRLRIWKKGDPSALSW